MGLPAGAAAEGQGSLARQGAGARLVEDGQLRAQLLDDLQELQAFLRRRCSELGSSSSSRAQVHRAPCPTRMGAWNTTRYTMASVPLSLKNFARCLYLGLSVQLLPARLLPG